MSRSEARFLARMLYGRTRTLSDQQRSEQSERARKTITKEELWYRGELGNLRTRSTARSLRLWRRLSGVSASAMARLEGLALVTF